MHIYAIYKHICLYDIYHIYVYMIRISNTKAYKQLVMFGCQLDKQFYCRNTRQSLSKAYVVKRFCTTPAHQTV